ncbi:putative F-box only protein 10 [Durio zibethinus]|uniref:F-box only protein 10 n=1 Tax=Durio zibethinus TaxID=66656 RepID=A0A6P6A7G0_DURZI|nr:putative F-box only protein 10 [Durio zibethinus]
MTSQSTLQPLTLPHELVTDILLCLPANSLQRFKSVSKPWGSLISDPNFVISHLHEAKASQKKVNRFRVGQIITTSDRPCLSLCSMDSNGSNREVVTLDYNFHYVRCVRILVLEGMIISGLGYECSSRNYKVILVYNCFTPPSSPHNDDNYEVFPEEHENQANNEEFEEELEDKFSTMSSDCSNKEIGSFDGGRP